MPVSMIYDEKFLLLYYCPQEYGKIAEGELMLEQLKEYSFIFNSLSLYNAIIPDAYKL